MDLVEDVLSFNKEHIKNLKRLSQKLETEEQKIGFTQRIDNKSAIKVRYGK